MVVNEAPRWFLRFFAVTCVLVATLTAAWAQDQNQPAARANQDAGAVRMARFSYVDGNVVWRPGPDGDWAGASVNLPIRQAAQIWVSDGGRAEIQFDDGSFLRIGDGTVIKLVTLYSDQKGEFTEIELTDGLVTLKARTAHSVYQFDTPLGSVTATGPSEVRIEVGTDLKVAVRSGTAALEAPSSTVTIQTGEYVDVAPGATDFQTKPLPEPDAWDKFNADRDAYLNHDEPNLPDNLRYIQPDLDNYGQWRQDEYLGSVWQPFIQNSDWRPYWNGNWTWVEPFGWTWVSLEPWGWAPYHYGTWIHRNWGWAWAPGPAYQYWSPGVVEFTYVGDNVYWVPLAPHDVTYPDPFDIGFAYGNWFEFFSIGYCGVFINERGHYRARHWRNLFVNNGRIEAATWQAQQLNMRGFVPTNARYGTTGTSFSAFANSGGNSAVPDGREAFQRGQGFKATAGGKLVFGPAAQPDRRSWSPTRNLIAAPRLPASLSRPIYRSGSQATFPRRVQPQLRPGPSSVPQSFPRRTQLTPRSNATPPRRSLAGTAPRPRPARVLPARRTGLRYGRKRAVRGGR